MGARRGDGGVAVFLPRKADGDTVPLLRETITLIPVSTKGTEKSTTSDLSSLIVSEPMAMSARLYTTCRGGGGKGQMSWCRECDLDYNSIRPVGSLHHYFFFSEPTATAFSGKSVTFLHSEAFFLFFFFPLCAPKRAVWEAAQEQLVGYKYRTCVSCASR